MSQSIPYPAAIRQIGIKGPALTAHFLNHEALHEGIAKLPGQLARDALGISDNRGHRLLLPITEQTAPLLRPFLLEAGASQEALHALRLDETVAQTQARDALATVGVTRTSSDLPQTVASALTAPVRQL